nr:hypothetical protein [Tanacetum cinerariifolium]
MRIPIISAKDKEKEKVTETEVPKKKKLQEQIDAQVAREMEDEFARENQRLSEQVARDSEIARIHAEEELKLMIEGLDRNNEVIAKHLSEYEQDEADLSVGEKIKLIKMVNMISLMEAANILSSRGAAARVSPADAFQLLMFPQLVEVFKLLVQFLPLPVCSAKSSAVATQQWNSYALTVAKCTSRGITITSTGNALEHFILNNSSINLILHLQLSFLN